MIPQTEVEEGYQFKENIRWVNPGDLVANTVTVHHTTLPCVLENTLKC